jgi:hypothetical protein
MFQSAQGNKLFVATLVGSVNVTDGSGNSIGTSTPHHPGHPGIISNDRHSSNGQNDAILASILEVIQGFNSKVGALTIIPIDSLTPGQKDWLAHAPKLLPDEVDALNSALSQYGWQLQPDLGGAQGGPNGGPGGGAGGQIPPAPFGGNNGNPGIVNPNDPNLNHPTTAA